MTKGLYTMVEDTGKSFLHRAFGGQGVIYKPESAETKVDDKNVQDVIATMRGLAEGRDLGSFIDTDEVMRYFAVQNFIQNYDSYIGGMLHNLVLCEADDIRATHPSMAVALLCALVSFCLRCVRV